MFKKVLDSLSLLFPEGEKYFVQSLRSFEKHCPEYIQKNLKEFYHEEANHTRWHREYNETLGVDIKAINEKVKARLAKTGAGDYDKLKTTLVLECLTKAGAHVLPYIAPVVLKDVPEPMKTLWLKHAEEERKHVSDVYAAGMWVGVTNFELFCHSPKVLTNFVAQIVDNWKRLS